jgi:hypothetical protein
MQNMETEKAAETSGSGVGLLTRKKTLNANQFPERGKTMGKSAFYNNKNRSGVYSGKKGASEL